MTGSAPPFVIDLARPLLALRFAGAQRMLSWSVSRPGFVDADAIAWLEVRDADLPVGRDPAAVLEERLAAAGLGGAVGLMTACDVSTYRIGRATAAGRRAVAVVTAGLGNGEFVGRRRQAIDEAPPPGTINVVVHVSSPLSDGALVEAVSIASEARTVAVLEAAAAAGDEPITGTGSDCLVVAAPRGGSIRYAGLHTAAGEAIGAAVLDACRQAMAAWYRDLGPCVLPSTGRVQSAGGKAGAT